MQQLTQQPMHQSMHQSMQQPMQQSMQQPMHQSTQQPMHPPPAQPPYIADYYSNPGYPTKSSSSFESWIGRNVIGIIASVLVFLGILFLGFLVIPTLGDWAQIALMFVLSAGLTAAGAALTIKKKNYFTQSLLGCGCGSIFISIMITHLYFQAIPDIAAFTLLLVWLVGMLVLVKTVNSLLISIIAHAGMIISLSLAYTAGMSQDRLVFILVYHAISVGIIIAAGILFYKKTMKLGLFASLGMSLVAVLALYEFFIDTLTAGSGLQIGLTIAIFCVQLIGALVLSFALVQSLARLQSGEARVIGHLVNITLLFGVILVAAYLFLINVFAQVLYGESVYFASYLTPMYNVALAPTIIAAVVAFGYLFASIFLSRRLQLNRALVLISVIASCLFVALLAMILYLFAAVWHSSAFHIPGLIVIAAVLAACWQITKDKVYLWLSFSVLMADLACMLFYGYYALAVYRSIIIGLVYLALSLAFLVYLWTRLSKQERAGMLTGFKLLMLGMAEVSILAIFSEHASLEAVPLLIVTTAFLVLFFLKFDARHITQGSFWVFMRIHELVLIAASSLLIASRGGLWFSPALSLALAVLSIALLVCTVYSISRAAGRHGWLGAFAGICFTLAVIAPLAGITAWLDVPYVLSLVLMISALVCVVGGFFTRLKPLRVYGLVLILCCVLKLVLLDMGDAETLMRVVAFITGGLICFGISALYSYAVKRLDAPAPR